MSLSMRLLELGVFLIVFYVIQVVAFAILTLYHLDRYHRQRQRQHEQFLRTWRRPGR